MSSSDNAALVAHLDQVSAQAVKKQVWLPYLNQSWVLALISFLWTGLLLFATDSPLIQNKKTKNTPPWQPTRSLGKLVGYSGLVSLLVFMGPQLWTHALKIKHKVLPPKTT